MAGHLLFNSGSNESSLAPQFKWLDNTFKTYLPIKARYVTFSEKYSCHILFFENLRQHIQNNCDTET